MLDVSPRILRNVIAPLIAAQFFLVVLIYFTTVRKRIASEYKLYVCFLATFTLYLLGRPVQLGVDLELKQFIMYARMIPFYGAGIPSLLVAVLCHSGRTLSRRQSMWIYGAAAVPLLFYVAFVDASMNHLIFDPDLLLSLGLPVDSQTAIYPRLIIECSLLFVPSAYLLVEEIRRQRRAALSAILIGSLVLGALLMAGPLLRDVWIVYIGSIFCAICWGWAAFRNLHDITSRSGRLKDELQLQVQTGEIRNSPDTDKILEELEKLSAGNPAVYKMRAREILSRLTDVTIEAGGDTDSLIQRHDQRSQAVDESTDARSIREIVRAEAVELSGMIAELPKTTKHRAVEQAEKYIMENYAEDLGVEDLAQTVGLSRTHFMREFKKSTGQTANQYLTAVRMEQAKVLLLEKSVTETAFAVGYNDSNYFGSVFKKKTGLTPSQFKAQSRT